MVGNIGRRLALLNAAVVVVVIALTGVVILLLLQQALSSEEESSLEERVESAATTWKQSIANGEAALVPNTIPTGARDSDEPEDDEDEHDGEEDEAGEDNEHESLLETSDTLLFAFDVSGNLLIDERGVTVAGLPVMESVRDALAGRVDTRTVNIEGTNVRVRSQPVRVDAQIIGVVQGARGQGEHEAQRKLVIWFTFAGIALGVLVAVPAGLFLAGRAMRPIEHAFAKQRAFVSDASHELRTPLAVIRAQAELIDRLVPADGQEIKEEIGIVVSEVDEMSRLVGDLLLLARLDENALAVATERFDLRQVAAEVVAGQHGRAASAGLSLRIEDGTSLPVEADIDRVKQVIKILLDNAIRYTPAGGTIVVAGEERGAQVSLSVTDTGIGIARADQDLVFGRFFRADKARTRSAGGTGLGLSIASGLIRSMNGQIGVESDIGAGSTFWITLPSRRG